MISAIAVGIPARDEEDRIREALDSVASAARSVAVPVFLAITADCCGDRTVERSRAALLSASVLAGWSIRHLAVGAAGAARDDACRQALDLCGRTGHMTSSTWLATTDADTTVPSGWLRRQLDWAEQGADGVAGLVELTGADGLSTRARRRWHDLVERAGRGIDHPHVHGANLGMRADVWLAAGGFAHCQVGEDHALWRRARSLGADLVGAPDIVVRTSARTSGRAPGGLAALLATLEL